MKRVLLVLSIIAIAGTISSQAEIAQDRLIEPEKTMPELVEGTGKSDTALLNDMENFQNNPTINSPAVLIVPPPYKVVKDFDDVKEGNGVLLIDIDTDGDGHEDSELWVTPVPTLDALGDIYDNNDKRFATKKRPPPLKVIRYQGAGG